VRFPIVIHSENSDQFEEGMGLENRFITAAVNTTIREDVPEFNIDDKLC